MTEGTQTRSINDVLSQAQEEVRKGENSKARLLFRQAIQMDPGCAYAQVRFAGLTLKNGPDQEGSAALEAAVLLDPELAVSECMLDLSMYMLDMFEGKKAELNWSQALITAFQKATLKKPDSAELHHHYGRLLVDLAMYDQATAEFERAFALQSNYPQCIVSLGELYLRREAGGMAAACFQKATGMPWPEPRSDRFKYPALETHLVTRSRAYTGLAKAYVLQKQYDLADSTALVATEVAEVDARDRSRAKRRTLRDVASAYEEEARAQVNQHDFKAACKLYRRQAAMQLQASPNDDGEWSEVALALYNSASCAYRHGEDLWEARRDTEAIAYWEYAQAAIDEALARLPASGRSDHARMKKWTDKRNKIIEARRRKRWFW